jgi:hypothetical protein
VTIVSASLISDVHKGRTPSITKNLTGVDFSPYHHTGEKSPYFLGTLRVTIKSDITTRLTDFVVRQESAGRASHQTTIARARLADIALQHPFWVRLLS